MQEDVSQSDLASLLKHTNRTIRTRSKKKKKHQQKQQPANQELWPASFVIFSSSITHLMLTVNESNISKDIRLVFTLTAKLTEIFQ